VANRVLLFQLIKKLRVQCRGRPVFGPWRRMRTPPQQAHSRSHDERAEFLDVVDLVFLEKEREQGFVGQLVGGLERVPAGGRRN
jgi:hypothetical protein